MARDGVANMVDRLRECGFDPRRVGRDSWESRCPAHRSVAHVLSITRNEHNHVELQCRSTENCPHFRIVGALGITNDHVYEETPDSVIRRLSGVPIEPASFGSSGAVGENEAGASVADGANGSAGTSPPREPNADADPTLPNGHRPQEATPNDHEGGAQIAVSSASCNDAVVGADGSEVALRSQALAPFPTSSPTDTAEPWDQTVPTSLEFHLSNITVIGQSSEKPERESSVRVLTRLASSARLFRSADGHYCAQVRVGDRLEIYGLRSAGFRDWLIDGYMIDQPEPPSNWTIRRVVGMLEAKARFTTGMSEVFIRVGQGGDGVDSPNARFPTGFPTASASSRLVGDLPATRCSRMTSGA